VKVYKVLKEAEKICFVRYVSSHHHLLIGTLSNELYVFSAVDAFQSVLFKFSGVFCRRPQITMPHLKSGLLATVGRIDGEITLVVRNMANSYHTIASVVLPSNHVTQLRFSPHGYHLLVTFLASPPTSGNGQHNRTLFEQEGKRYPFMVVYEILDREHALKQVWCAEAARDAAASTVTAALFLPHEPATLLLGFRDGRLARLPAKH
jgi:hypothetical protein